MSVTNTTASDQPTDISTLLQAGSVSTGDLKTGSLPLAWIIEGSPVVRARPLAKSGDDSFSCGLWDCTTGKFKYSYDCDEIVHILEGEVTIQEEADGARRTLRPGDVAFFAKGTTYYWTVPHYVKKFAIYRSVSHSLTGKIFSRMKTVLSRMAGAGAILIGSDQALADLQPLALWFCGA